MEKWIEDDDQIDDNKDDTNRTLADYSKQTVTGTRKRKKNYYLLKIRFEYIDNKRVRVS